MKIKHKIESDQIDIRALTNINHSLRKQIRFEDRLKTS